MESLAQLCTIITTTSPTPSNPSTELISSTLESLADFAPQLLSCRHILVCDGYKRTSGESRFRSGVVNEERAKAYERYMEQLELLSAGHEQVWRQVEVLRLAERQGFGFAVKAALQVVSTPFVCVMQHDRTFMRPFPDALAVIQCMMQEPRLKMVGLPTNTNDPSKYMTQAVTKMGEMKVLHPPFETLVLKVAHLRFIPLIMWHDSTHFASVSYYRDFVFGRRKLVARGGFIEDKLGQQQGMDLRDMGWSSHERYGTYLLDDGCTAPARMVGHLDGKRYLRLEAKAALEKEERAKAKPCAEEPVCSMCLDELSGALRIYGLK